MRHPLLLSAISLLSCCLIPVASAKTAGDFSSSSLVSPPPPGPPAQVSLTLAQIARLQKSMPLPLPTVKRVWLTRDCSQGGTFNTKGQCTTYRLWIDARTAGGKQPYKDGQLHVKLYSWYSGLQNFGGAGELPFLEQYYSTGFGSFENQTIRQLLEVQDGEHRAFWQLNIVFGNGLLKLPTVQLMDALKK